MSNLRNVRWWLDAKQVTSDYLNRRWSCLLSHVYVTRPQWVKQLLNAWNRPTSLTPFHNHSSSMDSLFQCNSVSGHEAQLSCHVPKIVAIGELGFGWERNWFATKLELWWEILVTAWVTDSYVFPRQIWPIFNSIHSMFIEKSELLSHGLLLLTWINWFTAGIRNYMS